MYTPEKQFNDLTIADPPVGAIDVVAYICTYLHVHTKSVHKVLAKYFRVLQEKVIERNCSKGSSWYLAARHIEL